MKKSSKKIWNDEVAMNVEKLKSVKKWLNKWINHNNTDWDSQKAAHQALKFLELAEFEMWHMQYWETSKQRRLYREAVESIL